MYTIVEIIVSDSRELFLTVEKCARLSRSCFLRAIVEKNVNYNRDFRLYLCSAVNARKSSKIAEI